MSNTREEAALSANARKRDIRLAKSDLLMMLGFVLALAVLCFTLGVRLGKKQAISDYQKLSLSQKMAESKRLDILDKINQEEETITPVEEVEPPEFVREEVVEKSNPFVEAEKEEAVEVAEVAEVAEVIEKVEEPEKAEVVEEVKPTKVTNVTKSIRPAINTDPIPFLDSGNPALSDSFTIIIGEFMEYEEASLFAQAFKERGYQPFLQKYSARGIDKIRVSLGSYISKAKAEKFILDRSEIFIAGKYKIDKFL